jgi:biotin synthase
MPKSYQSVLSSAVASILQGGLISTDEAAQLAAPDRVDLVSLLAAADRVRISFQGKRIDICSIVNARSGGCSEDCQFCAQSSHYATDAKVYTLVDPAEIERAAAEARKNGARRFCIVTSGRGIEDERDLWKIADGIERVRALGLSPCATLGTLNRKQLQTLQGAGLNRYHHNIETSREFFSSVCTTHTFDERTELLSVARDIGMSTCSGGILGMGESMQDRLSMAFSLRDLDVDSIPLNFLMPVPGTPLERIPPIKPLDALVSVALFRLILPTKEIRICGGRSRGLGMLHPFVFFAGADGFMMGNYLTRTGLHPSDDLRMLQDLGLTAAGE